MQELPDDAVLIRHARLVDGTGDPWTYGDLVLAAGRVHDVRPPGSVSPGRVREVVDAGGLVACPGFIDIQSHSIVPLMVDGRCLSKILQGVTTEIMGEAWTPGPVGGRIKAALRHTPYAERMTSWFERSREWERFGDWLRALVDQGVSPNVGSFLGGGTLREYVKGMAMGPFDAEELTLARRVTEEAMRDGALGVSFALIYPPDTYVTTDELVAICEVVGEQGGLYITHIRSESDRLEEGIAEAIEIGRRASLPVEIYHLKASGQRNWPKMDRVLRLIEEARSVGVDVTADMYPYVAAGTGLDAVVPPWVAADGKLYENLADPAIRARVREEVLHPSGDWESHVDLAGPEAVVPIGFERPEHRGYAGKSLDVIAGERDQEWVDAVLDLLVTERQRIATMYFLMSEENLVRQLQKPWIKISTDAGGMDPAWAAEAGPTHPRAYGTYPRVLGRYVREQGVLTLEDAVRKMSGAVAKRLGLHDRGLLAPGYRADVVLFDPTAIADTATFDHPHRLATGVRDVWVNGRRVVAGGAHTGATPGMLVPGAGATS
ncbi:MAG: amidohydrolase family protein [Candidatus Dormibacteraeota bacterium]|nr:amidohydrolase family protein [Candidatus Dormibacteraeota bacterium]